MRWIFLRHAYAGVSYNQENILADFRRELTGSGIEELRFVIFRSLPFFRKTTIIYSSPLVRAIQTAEILYSFIPHARLEILPALDKLESPKEFIHELSQLEAPDNACFVGHNPHLASSIKKLIGSGNIELEKSGMAVIEGDLDHGFKLTSLISPAMLRKI